MTATPGDLGRASQGSLTAGTMWKVAWTERDRWDVSEAETITWSEEWEGNEAEVVWGSGLEISEAFLQVHGEI